MWCSAVWWQTAVQYVRGASGGPLPPLRPGVLKWTPEGPGAAKPPNGIETDRFANQNYQFLVGEAITDLLSLCVMADCSV